MQLRNFVGGRPRHFGEGGAPVLDCYRWSISFVHTKALDVQDLNLS